MSADPSSSLSLILSALGAALGSERLCIHLLEDSSLVCAASLGLSPLLLSAWSRLPSGLPGGPVGLAAMTEQPVVEENARGGTAWAPFRDLARAAKVASSWSRCWAPAACSVSSPCSARSPASRNGTTSTWPPSTRATPRAPSSGTGSSRKSPPAIRCWRRSGRCWRPWRAPPRSPTGSASPCSRCAAACRPMKWRWSSSRPAARRPAAPPPARSATQVPRP